MSEPIIFDKKPQKVVLEAGTHWWCACGKSSHQPFCDGSHKGTGIAPVKMVVDEAKTVWLCNCKKTEGAPFCDGSHKNL